jgi:hypothetical protein
MRRTVALLALVPVLALAALAAGPRPASALPADTLDQSQAVHDVAVPDPVDTVDNNRTWWAQTFTAGLSGPLTRVQFVCTGTTNASITVSLTQVNAGGYPLLGPEYLLAQATAPCATPGEFNDFVFPAPVNVASGTLYGLTIPYSSGYSFEGAGGDLYTRGAAYNRNIYYAWYAIPTFDFAFKTYVQVEAASPSPTPTPTATPTPSPAATPTPTLAPTPTPEPSGDVLPASDVTPPPTSTAGTTQSDGRVGPVMAFLLVACAGLLVLAQKAGRQRR